jgi:hypothetical protein
MNHREIVAGFRRSSRLGGAHRSMPGQTALPFTPAHRIGAILAIVVRTAIVLGGIMTAAAFLP